MTPVTMKQLLEAGVHFGHQTKRWNPKMSRYIFGQRNGIYIIDLKKTLNLLREACSYVRDVISEGGTVLFVGTKKQAVDSIIEAAESCNMPYVSNRWLGGTLTNFGVIRQSVARLVDMDKMVEEGVVALMPKAEASVFNKNRNRLLKNYGGIKNMEKTPNVIFVVDSKKEHNCISEAKKLGIPIVAIVDSNCDPDEVNWIVPGNDDAIRSIKLISNKMADAAIEGVEIREQKKMEEQAKAADEEGQLEAAANAEAAPAEAAAADAGAAEAPKQDEPKAAEAPATDSFAEEPKA
jgi:small subunit ribosomal protein S2